MAWPLMEDIKTENETIQATSHKKGVVMTEHLNNLAIQAATKHLEFARKLLDQQFGSGWSAEKPEQVLTCAQLIAIEFNSIVIEKSAQESTDNLKSYLNNEF